MVYFKCKSCEGEHPSMVQIGDRKTFDNMTFSGNSMQCPRTGQMASYDKKDLVWRDEH